MMWSPRIRGNQASPRVEQNYSTLSTYLLPDHDYRIKAEKIKTLRAVMRRRSPQYT